MKHALLFLVAILFESCGGSQNLASNINDSQMPEQMLLSGTYEIPTLDDIILEEPLTMSFDDTKMSVSGFSGCNRFFGSYKTKGRTISFSQVGMTKMLCKDETDQIEQQFMSLLRSVNSFEVTDNGMKLMKNGTLLIEGIKEIAYREQDDIDLNMIYNATTRGVFERIWVEGDTIRFTNDRALKDISSYSIPQPMLDQLKDIYNKVDVEFIGLLEPPSKAFTYDGAAIATLEVIEGDMSFKTKAFDHGNPPKPISELVNKLLSIKEKMSKP